MRSVQKAGEFMPVIDCEPAVLNYQKGRHVRAQRRLRAAITAAKRAEVSESEIAGGKVNFFYFAQGGREALKNLETQADVRRSIEARCKPTGPLCFKVSQKIWKANM